MTLRFALPPSRLLLASALLGLAATGCTDDEIPLYIQAFGDTRNVTNGMTVEYGVLLSAQPKNVEYVDIDPDSIGGWESYITILSPVSKSIKWNPGEDAKKTFRVKAIQVTKSSAKIPFILRSNSSRQDLYIDVVGQNTPDAGHYEAGATPDQGTPDTSSSQESGVGKEAGAQKEAGQGG